jgi:ubiquinone/menaquinone biosynthesis C-methylase UbiE
MLRYNRSLFAAIVLMAALPTANAQLAARKADEWVTTLEGAQRVATSKIDEVLAKLALRPGMTVADIGAGSGLFARPLAKAIAPTGKLYAVDVQQDLLDVINKRAQDEKIANVQTVLGEFDDPKIPVRTVDLAFINDVLHHIQNRAVYLKALGTYIKPGGRIALIEMDSTDPNTPHRAQPELLVSRADIMKWMSDAGFKLTQEHADLFPGTKWFLVFSKN